MRPKTPLFNAILHTPISHQQCFYSMLSYTSSTMKIFFTILYRHLDTSSNHLSFLARTTLTLIQFVLVPECRIWFCGQNNNKHTRVRREPKKALARYNLRLFPFIACPWKRENVQYQRNYIVYTSMRNLPAHPRKKNEYPKMNHE